MSVPVGWEGGILLKGGHVSGSFQALGVFVSLAPVCGNALQCSAGMGWSRALRHAPTCGSGLWCPNLSFLACKPCVLLMHRNCMKLNSLFLSLGHPKMS